MVGCSSFRMLVLAMLMLLCVSQTPATETVIATAPAYPTQVIIDNQTKMMTYANVTFQSGNTTFYMMPQQ